MGIAINNRSLVRGGCASNIKDQLPISAGIKRLAPLLSSPHCAAPALRSASRSEAEVAGGARERTICQANRVQVSFRVLCVPQILKIVLGSDVLICPLQMNQCVIRWVVHSVNFKKKGIIIIWLSLIVLFQPGKIKF